MIKAVIAVVAVLAAFAAGMAGVYFAMPMLSPEKVEKAEAHLDSLAFVDSLAWAYSQGLPPGTTALMPDSLISSAPAGAPVPPDAPAATPDEADDQEAALVEDAGAEAEPEPEQVGRLDSLTLFQQQFEQLQREQQQLLEEVKSLKKQVDAQEAHGVEVEELSGTLAKLEDKELAGVVERLDMGVLEALYERASARNRKRLLQAMPPEAAAGFVRRLVRPQKNAVSVVSTPADTVATMPPSSSEPGSLN